PFGVSGFSINVASISYNMHPTTSDCFKNRIQLNYDPPPPDGTPALGFSLLNSATLTRVTKLTSISVKSKASCTGSETALRDYEFTYQADPDTQRPQLRSVTMKGREGTAERDHPVPIATYSYGSIVDPNTHTITYQDAGNSGPP